MLIDFSKLKKDPYGNIDAPEMILETLHDEIICPVDNYFGLQLELKLSEPSKATFSVPAYDNGVKTACYDELYAMRKIDIAPFGEYILGEPKTINDGQKVYKTFTASSSESLFSNRKIVLEAGTYLFYRADDLVSTNPVTIMGIVHSIIPEWKIAVDESLGGKYRTFDATDTGILSWLSGKAAKSFGCLFNFDSASKTIYVIDANAEYDLMDIYLSYDNLLKSGSRTEFTKEFLTVLDVYGADPVNIREVNPIGSNKIYNLDYFIENGDIYGELAAKWRSWQNEIAMQQDYYTCLSILRNSATARKIMAQAKENDLKGERDDVKNRMAVITTLLARPDQWDTQQDPATRERLEQQYEELTADLEDKQAELETQIAVREEIESEIQAHTANISALLSSLRLTSYFTTAELGVLSRYFIEDDFTDDTFAVFDVDVTGQNDVYDEEDSDILYLHLTSDEDLVEIDLSGIDEDGIINKRIFSLNGGNFNILVNETSVSASIISGTIDVDKSTGAVTCSIYAGSGAYSIADSEARQFVNANISLVSSGSSILEPTDGEQQIVLDGVRLYMTRNVAQFQSYAVQKELYDYAVEQHKAIAYPSGQFDIASGNILFAEEFEDYKDRLRLGCGLYLNFDDVVLTPLLLEIQFSFEDETKFDLIFSNTYRRHDNVQTMKDMLKESKSSSRKLEMAKYNYGAYNRTGAESEVRTLFREGLDTARTQILAGKDHSVTIDRAGITVKDPNDTTSYIAINNGMIAYMDESDQARMAIGKFYDTGMGQVMYGVVAPNVVGTLLAGENLIIQSTKIDGTNMYFSVDASGAKLANGIFDLYRISSNNGLAVSDKTISLNPDLGIIVGNLQRAISYDQLGNITGVNIATEQGSSTNIGTAMTIAEAKEDYTNAIANLTPNFWVDLNGDVFMRGTVYATDGVFSGTIYAENGEFSGDLTAATINGNLSAADDGLEHWLIGTGIKVGGSIGGATENPNFKVDSDGNVTMNGNIVLGGNITWSATNKPKTDVTYTSIVDALKTTATEDGIYAKDGKIHINASMIDAGTVSASRISAGTLDADAISTTGVFTFKKDNISYGTIGQFVGETSIGETVTKTYGTAMFSKDNKFFVITTDGGSRMSDASRTHSIYVSDAYAVMLAGGARVRCDGTNNSVHIEGNSVYYNDSPVTLSDRKIKSDISYDMERYENFFMDLKPSFYHVNHGTSGRYHVGFIAPDVEDSLHRNGLTTKDFAGYVVLNVPSDDGMPDEIISSLRYEEFIPLNTYMIQKLMARVDELESILGGTE